MSIGLITRRPVFASALAGLAGLVPGAAAAAGPRVLAAGRTRMGARHAGRMWVRPGVRIDAGTAVLVSMAGGVVGQTIVAIIDPDNDRFLVYINPAPTEHPADFSWLVVQP